MKNLVALVIIFILSLSLFFAGCTMPWEKKEPSLLERMTNSPPSQPSTINPSVQETVNNTINQSISNISTNQSNLTNDANNTGSEEANTFVKMSEILPKSLIEGRVAYCEQLSNNSDVLLCIQKWCESRIADKLQCDRLQNINTRLSCLQFCNN